MSLTQREVEEADVRENAMGDVEIVLRDRGIRYLTNLDHIPPTVDTLDLTFNHVFHFEVFTEVLQLKHVYLSSNRVETVDEGIGKKIPNITSLDLRHNRISDPAHLIGFQHCPHLRILLLNDNPLMDIPHMRTQIISQLPQVEVLNGEWVTREERALGKEERGKVEGEIVLEGCG